MQAKTNFYGDELSAACLGCFNPREKQVVAVSKLEQRLRSMNASERTRFLNEQNVDAAAVEEYLMNPQCGHLGAAAIQDLAIIPTEQFSVGFVSLGSGVLIAANLIREITQSMKSAENSVTSINFPNGGIWHSTSPSDDACEIGGHSASP